MTKRRYNVRISFGLELDALSPDDDEISKIVREAIVRFCILHDRGLMAAMCNVDAAVVDASLESITECAEPA